MVRSAGGVECGFTDMGFGLVRGGGFALLMNLFLIIGEEFEYIGGGSGSLCWSFPKLLPYCV